MKKIAVIIALAAFALTANAQLRLDNAKNYANPKKGYYDKAKVEIDAACEDEGTKNNAEVWAWKGLIYCRLGESDKPKHQKVTPANWADIAYEAALKSKELNTEKEASIIDLNNAVFKTVAGRFIEEAYADYEKAGESNDTAVANPLYRSCITKVDKGVKIFQSAGATNDKDIKASLNYARFIGGAAARAIGDNKSCVKFYKPLVKAKYDKAYVYQSLVSIYLNDKDTVEAMKVAKTFTENQPDDLSSYILAAKVSAGAKNVENARNYANKAIEKSANIQDPAQRSNFLSSVADIYTDMMDYETAIKEFNHALEVSPNNPMVYNGLGRLYFNKGFDIKQQADALPFDQTDKYDELLAQAKVEFEEAIKMYKKSLEINDKSTRELVQRYAEALRGLKHIYVSLNKPMDDLKVYEQ